jgi:serine/threonine protein kinase
MLEPYNYKCAVWSLGLIVYEMLTGKYLFEKFKKRAQLVE